MTNGTSINRDLPDADLAEAHRIAGQLVKLHARGIIKDATDPEARFYAGLIHQFGGTVVAGDKTKPDDKPVKLTDAQRVKVPYGLRGKALNDYLQKDLEGAFRDEVEQRGNGVQEPRKKISSGRRPTDYEDNKKPK